MQGEPSPIGDVRQAATLAGEIIKVAKDNPDARAAGSSAAKSLQVLSESLYTLLTPLRVLNFAARQTEAYFQEKFGKELGERLREISPDDIVAPKPYVAGPALQGIADTIEEDALRELYLNLLAKAMDGTDEGSAHPAFVDIIKQLDAAEAQSLRAFIGADEYIPAAELRSRDTDGTNTGYIQHERHITSKFDFGEESTAHGAARVEAFVENWSRLGLITYSYTTHVTREDAYDWVKQRPKWTTRESLIESDQTLEFQKGLITRTAFGARFAAAVGIDEADGFE